MDGFEHMRCHWRGFDLRDNCSRDENPLRIQTLRRTTGCSIRGRGTKNREYYCSSDFLATRGADI